jgi:hypothetical protein
MTAKVAGLPLVNETVVEDVAKTACPLQVRNGMAAATRPNVGMFDRVSPYNVRPLSGRGGARATSDRK